MPIYKVNIKDGVSEKFVEGNSYWNLSVIGDYIYCNEYDGNIYKIGIKDKNITSVLDKQRFQLGLKDGEGSFSEILYESGNYLNFVGMDDNYMYLVEFGSLYRYSIDEKANTLILEKDVNYITVKDRWGYYEEDNSIYRTKIDTNKVEKVSDEAVDYMFGL